jgi:hypothetical protein
MYSQDLTNKQTMAVDMGYEFKLPAKYTDRTRYPLPASVDNRNKYLRPRYVQGGWACASANGVSYVFGYELCNARDLDASKEENQYPYTFTFAFYNKGSTGEQDRDLFKVGQILPSVWSTLKDNGIINNKENSGFMNGYPDKWINGYELYYSGMQNRISDYFYANANKTEGIEAIKQWMYDHADGSPVGGIGNFFVSHYGTSVKKLANGTPHSGQSVVDKFGTSQQMGVNHTMTVVGYNDSIQYDFNKDGKYTNDKDINNDGKIDIRDWEIGAWIVVQTDDDVWGDNYCAYAPYRLFASTWDQGGLGENSKVYMCKVHKNYKPQMTFKIKLTHNKRDQLAITPGFAPDATASAPTKTINYVYLFHYAGGSLPMQGENKSSTIEIGLDVSSLLKELSTDTKGKFFLQIDSKGGAGKINSFALMDYTGGTVKEILCAKSETAIPTGKTVLDITADVSVDTKINKNNKAPTANSIIIAPNIVNTSTNIIQFKLPLSTVNTSSRLEIYSVNGKQIISIPLWASESQKSYSWDLQNRHGSRIASGNYFAVLTSTTKTIDRAYFTVVR